MTVPDFLKPVTWPLVGGVFRNFYESPAENGCFGLVLIVFAMIPWMIGNVVTGSMIGGLLWGGPFFLWGVGHFIAMFVMIIRVEMAEAQREKEKREAALRKQGIIE
jgi:hypothetical protein